jgi:Integrase zinc binding domain
VGGRLKNANISKGMKNPILIPRHHFANLLIQKAHKDLLHGTELQTLNHLRNEFWIQNGKAAVEKTLKGCIKCYRYNTKPSQNQIMGNLPSSRILPAPPFTSTGVDFAGPAQESIKRTAIKLNESIRPPKKRRKIIAWSASPQSNGGGRNLATQKSFKTIAIMVLFTIILAKTKATAVAPIKQSGTFLNHINTVYMMKGKIHLDHPTALNKVSIKEQFQKMINKLSAIKGEMKLTYLEEAYKTHINATKYRMQAIEMHLEKIQPLRLKRSSGVLGYIGKFIFGTNDLEDQILQCKRN